LNPFPGNRGAAAVFSPDGNLVDLINKNNSRLFYPLSGFVAYTIPVD
jgi:hypothetical protein